MKPKMWLVVRAKCSHAIMNSANAVAEHDRAPRAAPVGGIAGCKRVVGLNWKNPTRVLMHFADAPCHGREFSGCDDNYPGDGPLIKPLLKQLDNGLQLDYFFGAINSSTDKMVKEMNSQMGKEFVKAVQLRGAGATSAAVGASIHSAVTKSVRSSLSARRTAASRSLAGEPAGGGSMAVPKGYLAYAPLKPSPAAFAKLPRLPMKVYINTGIESLEALRTEAESLLTFSVAVPVGGASADSMRCQVMATPFSAGGIRLAFHALVRAPPPAHANSVHPGCSGSERASCAWSLSVIRRSSGSSVLRSGRDAAPPRRS